MDANRSTIRVLLVDDSAADREELAAELEGAETDRVAYRIDTADRLATAFEKLAGSPPDVAILDLFLPESKGIGTLRRFFGKAPGTPVVALTRFDDEMTGRSAVAEGAQDYLVKGHLDGDILSRSLHHALERHKIQQLMRQKNTELEVLNRKLCEADRLKSVFLANMSHELRTPLNSIIGFSNIMLKGISGPLTEDQRKQLQMVQNSGLHLLQLINELLDVSKIEAGKIELGFQSFHLQELLEEVRNSLLPAVAGKPLTFAAPTGGDLDLVTDRLRLKQILVNLANNAVKFTEAGHVSLEARAVTDGRVEIRVTDTGIGIAREDMKMLFIPFHQLDMSRTKKYQGTGLGLHLSQKLAHLLGGEIRAESRQGKGSCFTVTIPAIHPDTRTAPWNAC